MEKVRDRIIEAYDSMTTVERGVADFFLKNEDLMDFSSRNISGLLYISEPTLSRFAQKCGYDGYRKFIYDYEKEIAEAIRERNISELSRRVKGTYERLLNEEFQQLEEEKVKKVSEMLGKAEKVYVCGRGSSGFAAWEFYLRFMRLGLEVQALTDPQVISMIAAVSGPETLVIGISLSGHTEEILEALTTAKSRNASAVLITSDRDTAMKSVCDEVLLVAGDRNMDTGTEISPQFPILMLMDVLYMYYLKNDTKEKTRRLNETLKALHEHRKPEEGERGNEQDE